MIDTTNKVLSSIEKGAHILGHNLPGSMKYASKGVEILREIVNNKSVDDIERITAGVISAVTKIAIGSVVIGGCIVQPEISLPIIGSSVLAQTAVATSVGVTADNVLDIALQPIDDVINKTVHNAFLLFKEKEQNLYNKNNKNTEDIILSSPYLQKFLSMLKDKNSKKMEISRESLNHALLDSVSELIYHNFSEDIEIKEQYELYKSKSKLVTEKDTEKKNKNNNKNNDKENKSEKVFNEYIQQIDNIIYRKYNSEEIQKNVMITWLNFGDKLSYFTSQVGIATNNKDLMNFSNGVLSVTQSISGFNEFSKGMNSLKCAKDCLSVADSLSNVLSGAGTVVSAISLIASLFKKKQQGSYNFSSATYFAIMAMWNEMRSNFQLIHDKFEKTWVKLEWLDANSVERFHIMLNIIEKNHIKLENSINQLTTEMHERFNNLDFKLNKIEERNRKENISVTFTNLLLNINNNAHKFMSNEDFNNKLTLLLKLYSSEIQNQNLSGIRIGNMTSYDNLHYAILSLDNPAFTFTTLGSYMNSVHSFIENDCVYTRSQMTYIVNELKKKYHACNVKILYPIGLEHFFKLNNYIKINSHNDKILIPIEFGGSWFLLVVKYDEYIYAELYGLKSVIEQCLNYLLQSNIGFIITTKIFEGDISESKTGICVNNLMQSIIENIENNDISSDVLVARTDIPVPTPNEQQYGNPLIDWLLGLYIQRAFLLNYYNNKNQNQNNMIESSVIEKIENTISNFSNYSQLLVRIQNPKLYEYMIENYKIEYNNFIDLYNKWMSDTAKKISTEENVIISQKFTEIDGLFMPMSIYSYDMNNDPNPNYYSTWESNHKYTWWKTTYSYQDVCSRYGHGDGFKTSIKCDKNKINEKIIEYKSTLKNNYINIIKSHLNNINSIRQSFKLNYDFTSVILNNNTLLNLQNENQHNIYNFCLVPKKTKNPYLVSPKNIEILIPDKFNIAYKYGCIDIRFSYDIIDKMFIIYGEWKNKNESIFSNLFAEIKYEYDPLFYKNTDAILNFWYGGTMPLNQNTEILSYDHGWSGQAPTVGCRQWYSQIYTPIYSSRTGAINIDINSVQKIDIEMTSHYQVIDIALNKYEQYLKYKIMSMLKYELSNSSSPLSKAFSKVDVNINLIKKYINLLSFASQTESMISLSQNIFSNRLFDSQSVLKQIDKQIYELNFPTIGDIDNEKKCILSTLSNIETLGFMTPLSNGSILLFEILKDYHRNNKIHDIQSKIKVLDSYIFNMQSKIEDLFRNSGDTVYTQALINELKKNNENILKLSGEMYEAHKTECEMFKKLYENQKLIIDKLNNFSELIKNVDDLVKKNVLSKYSYKYLKEQYEVLYSQYIIIGNLLIENMDEYDDD
jgi:hypothetical protein